ncbi:pinopsin-like [Ptychodera flava]|uniref:pinopsin-like n=1 Tax=Ptychodera flava TaxID=63121 RepID=UPI003969C221
MTLTAISFERYSAVKDPLSVITVNRYRRAGISLFVVWSYSLVLTSPPLYGWGSFAVEGGISCSVDWGLSSRGNSAYILTLFVFCFFFPLMCMLYSYLKVVKSYRKVSDQELTWCSRVARTRERKLARTSAFMVIAFVVCWTPYAVTALVALFGSPFRVSMLMEILSGIFAKSSAVCNPIIYFFQSEKYRRSLQKMFRVCIGRKSKENRKQSKLYVQNRGAAIVQPDSSRNNRTHSQNKAIATHNGRLDGRSVQPMVTNIGASSIFTIGGWPRADAYGNK